MTRPSLSRLFLLLCSIIIVKLCTAQTTFDIISQGVLVKSEEQHHDDEDSLVSLFPGYDDCPCVDTRSTIEEAVESGQLQRCSLGTTTSGDSSEEQQEGVLLEGICYPYSYGSSYCKAHDLLRPECDVPITSSSDMTRRPSSTTPSFCYDQWCYVDPNKCRLSFRSFFGSQTLKQFARNRFYYSYSTCNSTTKRHHDYKTTNALQDKWITVTLPGYVPPGHFKMNPNGTTMARNEDGPEYYNDSLPWKGWMIDWLEAVAAVNDFAGFRYTSRTKYADSVSPNNVYTAAMIDVQAGITDMAASPKFWITPARTEQVSFTTPVTSTGLFLWVRQPSIQNDFKTSASRAALPFSPSLWGCLIAAITITSLLVVLFVNENGSKRKWWRKLHDEQYKHSTALEKVWIVTRICMDSLLQQSTSFFGQSVEYDMYGGMAQKVLMFGFGFLILIVVASYTANLAAFLTISSVGDFVSSMEEASRDKNVKICAFQSLKQELVERWPFATFHFTDAGKSLTFRFLLQAYDQGQCQGIVLAELASQLDPILQKELCSRKLVMTDSLVTSMHVAFPAQPDVAPAMSYFILKAAKLGITYEKYYSANLPTPLCPLKLDAGGGSATVDELMALTPSNMALPFVVFAICVFLSLLIHFWSQESRRRNKRKTKLRQMKDSGSGTRHLRCRSSLVVPNNDFVLDNNNNNNNTPGTSSWNEDEEKETALPHGASRLSSLGLDRNDNDEKPVRLSSIDEESSIRGDHRRTSTCMGNNISWVSSSFLDSLADELVEVPAASKRTLSIGESHNGRGAAGTTTSSRRGSRRTMMSIDEILPTLRDGEASRDIEGTMEALSSLQAYQQQMMEGLQEQLRKKQR